MYCNFHKVCYTMSSELIAMFNHWSLSRCSSEWRLFYYKEYICVMISPIKI
nr:MAG TPA: hypothetical protein [Caudoviricetes sp.]